MKKLFTTTILALAICAAAVAQPRAAGLRLGWGGAELSYEHNLGFNFLEAELGADLFAPKLPGFKLTALYNYVIDNDMHWTSQGFWGCYVGAGLTTGYVADLIKTGVDPVRDMGFMMGIALQLGIEYTFNFPLQLSADIRPVVGFHTEDGTSPEGIPYGKGTGFYNNGIYGFFPTVSVRYVF